MSVHEVLLGEVEPSAAVVSTPEGMMLLPANIDLAGAEAMLLMRAGREYALKRALAKLGELDLDVVILDCPPSLGVLTLNGLTAADEVIVPLQCETLAHRGVGQFPHRRRRPADHQPQSDPAGRCPPSTTLAPRTAVTFYSMSQTATNCRSCRRRSRGRCGSPRPAPQARR